MCINNLLLQLPLDWLRTSVTSSQMSLLQTVSTRRKKSDILQCTVLYTVYSHARQRAGDPSSCTVHCTVYYSTILYSTVLLASVQYSTKVQLYQQQTVEEVLVSFITRSKVRTNERPFMNLQYCTYSTYCTVFHSTLRTYSTVDGLYCHSVQYSTLTQAIHVHGKASKTILYCQV